MIGVYETEGKGLCFPSEPHSLSVPWENSMKKNGPLFTLSGNCALISTALTCQNRLSGRRPLFIPLHHTASVLHVVSWHYGRPVGWRSFFVKKASTYSNFQPMVHARLHGNSTPLSKVINKSGSLNARKQIHTCLILYQNRDKWNVLSD